MTAAKKNSPLSQIDVVPRSALVENIPVWELRVSLEEARKTLDQAALEDLAKSIAKDGVIEPLLVRPLEAPEGWNDGPLYGIVAGQRRFEASKIAGKKACPCIVRSMTDEEAHETAIISNLQREDLPALEEAMAFRSLLDVPGATVETVAAKLAKSASYVGRRLKLLDAIEPVREALQAGAIEVGHALELARLDTNQQIWHLSRLNCGFDGNADGQEDDDDDSPDGDEGEEGFDDEEDDDDEDGQEPAGEKPIRWRATGGSVAELRREIAATTLRVLADAPFPLDDELPPMACTECPKRSGNAALLFDDCAQDTCTDRECFDAKVKVWIKHELDQADKEKRKLLMLSDGYTSNRAAICDYNVMVLDERKSVVSCAEQEEAIWINGDKAGHRTLICRDAQCKTHQSPGRSFSSEPKSDPVKAKADRKILLAKVKVEKEYRLQLFKELMANPVHPEPTDAMVQELVVFAMGRFDSTKHDVLSQVLDWPKDYFGWQRESKGALARLSMLTQGDAVRIALVGLEANELTVHEHDIDRKNNSGKKPEIGLERVAKLIGVDVAAIRKRVDPSAAKEPKAPAKKPAPKKAAPKKATPQKTAKKPAKKAPAKRAKGGSK